MIRSMCFCMICFYIKHYSGEYPSSHAWETQLAEQETIEEDIDEEMDDEEYEKLAMGSSGIIAGEHRPKTTTIQSEEILGFEEIDALFDEFILKSEQDDKQDEMHEIQQMAQLENKKLNMKRM